jgi:hypothetical protein
MPLNVLIDNARAMITSPHATAPRANDAFADYAQARGIFIDTARVRRPKDKARVENQVPFVRESWFDGEQFFDVDEARHSAEQWCRFAAERVHGTTRQVVREHYEREEKASMLPAPTERFDVPLWTNAKVQPDHHIQVQRALYSVPTRYIGKTVRVRSDQVTVRIYLGGELIKAHPRQAPGGRSTDPNDYPKGKQAYATRAFSTVIEQAHKQGPHIGEYAERLLNRPLPWTMMRWGYLLLKLCDRYGPAKVDAVCERSLSFDVIDVPRIERMLKQALQVENAAETEGKLHKLPGSPRFARDAHVYSTQKNRREDG